jgi:hypothetical protein
MKMSELHAERSTEQMLEDEVCSLQRQLRETATLRDQFAMAAMTGLMAINPAAGSLEGIAEFSYIAADAMLKARESE